MITVNTLISNPSWHEPLNVKKSFLVTSLEFAMCAFMVYNLVYQVDGVYIVEWNSRPIHKIGSIKWRFHKNRNKIILTK